MVEAAAQLLEPLAASDAAAACLMSLVPAKNTVPVNAATLTPFTRLERLERWNSRNMRGSVGHLFSLQRLTRLQLSGMDVRGSWAGLRRLTALQSLDVDRCDVEGVLCALPALRALSHLSLWCDLWMFPGGGAGTEEFAWHNLSTLSQLRRLRLAGFEPATAQVAAQLRQLAPGLQDVRLYGDAVETLLLSLQPAAGLTRLALHVEGDEVEFPAAALALLRPSLRDLEIHAFFFDDPDAVPGALAAACPQLTRLVRRAGLLAGRSAGLGLAQLLLPLFALAQSLPNTGCDAVDAWEDLCSLQQLQSLDLRGCLLEVVPHQLTALSRLTHLDLSSNNILPASWRRLRALPLLVDPQPPEAMQLVRADRSGPLPTAPLSALVPMPPFLLLCCSTQRHMHPHSASCHPLPPVACIPSSAF